MRFSLIIVFLLGACSEPAGLLKGSGHRTLPPEGYSVYCSLPENKNAVECGK